MYLVYKDIKKIWGRGQASTAVRFYLPSVVGLRCSLFSSTLRRWAMPFVIGFFPPSFGSALQCWAMPFVVGLCPSLLGSALRCWVLPFVVGFCPLSLDSALRRWVLPSSIGLCPLLFGSSVRHWATPFVIRFFHLSLGYALCRSVLSSVIRFCPPSLGYALRRLGLPSIIGLVIAGVVGQVLGTVWSNLPLVGNWERRNGRKRTTIPIVVRFLDALAGPPNSWVPAGVSPSPIPSLNENDSPAGIVVWAHIPQERGGAPLREIPCRWERNEVVRVKVVVAGWVGDERNSTVMGLMCHLNSAGSQRLCLIETLDSSIRK